MELTRRNVLAAGGALMSAGLLPRRGLAQDKGFWLAPDLPEGTRQEAVLDALPGKAPLVKLTYRPPNYETPIHYFDSVLTPNEAFFVRYHLADIPEIDPAAWRLRVGGDGAERSVELTLDALKRFEPVELVAVCQCSGNRRGLFRPHVPGVEWGYGAMGNARWKGARLRDVLNRAGLRKDALEVAFDGADGPPHPATPDFQKSIPVWKALQDEVLVAYEMNGEPLPHWNGFPARLIVPGWTGTYWVKHLTSVSVLPKPFDNFWMKSAYRIPLFAFPLVERFVSQQTGANTPITEMVVNSLITHPLDGARVPAGQRLEIRGIAWDGGYGIQGVDVSTDGGRTWMAATMGENQGRYGFHGWTAGVTPQPGALTIMARAFNRVGQTQTTALVQNPAGYHHNLVQRVAVTAG